MRPRVRFDRIGISENLHAPPFGYRKGSPRRVPYLQTIQHRPPSLWTRAREAIRSRWITGLSLKDPALASFYNVSGGATAAGVPIDERTALNYAAVWQAVTLIAGDVGSLPLPLYKRLKDGGKDRYTDHLLYSILHDAPNPEMSSMVFRETLQAHLLTWGNAYAEIERDAAGRVVALWPLLPDQVTPYRDEARGRQLRYRVRAGNDRPDILFDAGDILHVPGLGFDGTCGYSPIQKARESLGLGIAAEKFGATFYGSGTTFGGALRHPKVLGEAGQKSLRESVNKYHQGSDKAHRFLILEEGMEYTKFGVDPDAAQFLETRQFQIAEVARWFNLPLHKLREMEHSSVRANIEQEALDYYVSTLRPWLVRWEQEINRKLISPRERNIQFAEFVLEGVLRGDQKSRYDAYAVARQWGWMSVNEIRELENLNPVADGNVYLTPLNMTPANRLNEVIDAQVRPPEPPTPPAGNSPPAEPAPRSADDDAAARALVEQMAAQAREIGELRARSDLLEPKLVAAEAAAARAAIDAEEFAKTGRYATSLEDDLARQQAALDAARIALEEGAGTVRVLEDARAAAEATQNALNQAWAEERAKLEQAEADAKAAVRVLYDERRELAAQIEAAQQQAATAAIEARARETATAQALEAAALASARELEQAKAEALTREQALEAERQALAAQIAAVQEQAATDAAEAATARSLTDAANARHASADTLAAAAAAERDMALVSLTAADARAAQAEAERLAAVEALAQTTQAHAERITALIAANRVVLADTLHRMIYREAERARSKRATPQKLRVWAETFYEAHELDLWCQALTPAIGVHLALTGRQDDPALVAQQLAAAHMGVSQQQILAVCDADPEDYQRALDLTLQRWEGSRAAAAVDALLREEIAHVRTI